MNALSRGLLILQELTVADGPLGVTELAHRVGADKSTVHRLLATLVGSGFAEQDPLTRQYRPSSKLIWMGSLLLGRIDVREHAAPYLKDLARQSGFASHLVVLADDHVLYVGQERSPSSVTVDIPLGGVAPAYCTAVGKALLADLPESALQPYLSNIRPHTDKTIVDPAAFHRELALVRERGYAVDDEEFNLGVRCLAAPIKDHADRTVASIGVSGPAPDFPMAMASTVADVVRRTAGEISARLGNEAAAFGGPHARAVAVAG